MRRLLFFIMQCFVLTYAFAQSPGNVPSNLQWWFKANDGTSTVVDKNQVDSWENKGGFKTKEIVRMTNSNPGFPKFLQNEINSNPALQFSSTSIAGFQTFSSDITNMLPLAKNSTVFVVYKSPQKSGSISGLHYYCPYILGTESEATRKDYVFGFTDGRVSMKCDSTDYWSVFSTTKYNDNKCHIALASRKMGATAIKPSDVEVMVDGLKIGNVGYTNTSYDLNSSNYTNPAYYHGFTVGVQLDRTQFLLNENTGFNGDIAEIIVYDTVINSMETRKINSYLAIKYGLTLDQKSPNNYVSADGITIWDASDFTVFNKDIAGIGYDVHAGLFQPQSQSINTNAVVIVNEASSLDSSDFLVWSDNGLNTYATSVTFSDIVAPIESRIERVWQIQKTGEVGTVSVTLDLAQVPGNLNLNDLRLMLDDDGQFKLGTKLYAPKSITDRKVKFEMVDFNARTGKYFTLGSVDRFNTPLSSTIIPRPELVIYEYITPNGDGQNDNFKIMNIDYFPENELFVYSHDGLEVFHKKNYFNGAWECSNIADGFYYYVFKTGNIKRSGEIVVQH